MKEEKICSFTQNKYRLQLLKITEIKDFYTVEEIINTVGGYKAIYTDGHEIHIYDNSLEYEVMRWGLKKINENHYIVDPEYKKKYSQYKIKYQVRLNRKIIDTSISEYQMRKLFATYCQNIVLQLKIY